MEASIRTSFKMHGGSIMGAVVFSILKVIFDNKRWAVIVLLLVYAFFQTWQVNYLAGQNQKLKNEHKEAISKLTEDHVLQTKKKDQKHSEDINEIVDRYRQNEHELVKSLSDLSLQLEQYKQSQQVKKEVVIREIEKITVDPVYVNQCFSLDGLQLINSLGSGNKNGGSDQASANTTKP